MWRFGIKTMLMKLWLRDQPVQLQKGDVNN